MLSDYFDALKTIAWFLFGLLLVSAILWGCWGSYLVDPSLRINKVEKGVVVTLYSDSTAFCGAHSDEYFTVVALDSTETVGWASPCCRCGEKYGGHHSKYYWSMSEAQANYPN